MRERYKGKLEEAKVIFAETKDVRETAHRLGVSHTWLYVNLRDIIRPKTPRKTEENVKIAQQMTNEGVTTQQIADKFGVTPRVIRHWLGPKSPGNLAHRGPPIPDQVIPDDTRGVTERLMGDPLRGRSALDMKRQS